MRMLSSTVAILGSLLFTLPASSGEQIPYQIYAKGYFVKNTVALSSDQAFFVLQDKKSFDQIFGIGVVMGAKPKLVDDALFEKNLVAVVIKSGNTPWKYQVEDVRLEKKQLIVKYKVTGKESATAKFRSPLILSVPRGTYTEIVWIENGKEAGKQAVKK